MEQLIRNLTTAQQAASLEIVNTMKSMRANTAKQAIPLFTGTLDGISAHDWLEIGDQVARAEGWTEEETSTRLQERLIPPASTVNAKLTAETRADPALWRPAFLKEFEDETRNIQLSASLENLAQEPNERVRDFENRLNILYQRVYGVGAATSNDAAMKSVRNKQKKKIFLKGLSKPIYNLIWNRIDPEAVDEWGEITKAAKAAEAVIYTKRNTDSCQSTDAIITALQEEKAKIEEMTKKVAEQISTFSVQANH